MMLLLEGIAPVGGCNERGLFGEEVATGRGFYKVVYMREFVEFHIVRFQHPSLLRVNGHRPLE